MLRISSVPNYRLRKLAAFLLASLWCAGIAWGIVLSSRVEADFLLQMRRAFCRPVSIVGLLGAALIPFLLSALAVFLCMPWLLYPICLCKALAFSFTASCVLRAFGPSGWLAGWFVLFGSGIGVPVLLWFWYRHLFRGASLSQGGAAVQVALLLLAAGFHIRIVSPFWVSLLF